MRATKQQAAILQLCDAIELFKKEPYISAITLAAASEEVLAQLLKQHAAKTGTPYFTAEELEAGMFDMFKDFLTGDFRQIALNHIAGAVQNFKMVNGYLPKKPVITDFCIEIGIS